MPKHLVSTARAAAFVGLVTFALTACGGDDFARKYAALRAEALAKAANRFGPGRPAGVPWSPPRSPLAGAPAAAREAAAPSNGVTRGSRSVVGAPIEHADLGLTQLVDRGLGASVDQVVENFELAFPEGQGDPTFLNDFATALLERARPRDLILGGEYAARARNAAEEDDPDGDLARAARFNWALAMERLALHGQATAAWQAVLARESDASWRAEAEEHAADLTEWPVARWPKERERLRQAAARGDQATVAEILPDFRTAARLMAEDEELKTWAETVERDPPKAREALAVARTIGQVLEPTDAFLADVVDGIDAAAGDVKKAAELAAAMRGFFGGLEAYKEFSWQSAALKLDRAGHELGSLASPLQWRARFHLLAISDHLSLREVLDRHDEQVEQVPARWRSLRSQLFYSRGWARHEMGYPEESIEDLVEAVRTLEELGELDLEVAYRSMLGSAYRRSHDEEGAAREDTRFFASISGVVVPYYRYFVAVAVDLRCRTWDPAGAEVRLATLSEVNRVIADLGRVALEVEWRSSLFGALGTMGRWREAEAEKGRALNLIPRLEPEDQGWATADLLRISARFPDRLWHRSREHILERALALYEEEAKQAGPRGSGLNRRLTKRRVAVLRDLSSRVLARGRKAEARDYAERAWTLLRPRAGKSDGDRRLGLAREVRSVAEVRLRAGVGEESENDLFGWVEAGHHLATPGPWSEPRTVLDLLASTRAQVGVTLVEVAWPRPSVVEPVLVFVARRGQVHLHSLDLADLAADYACLDSRGSRDTAACTEPWSHYAATFAHRALEPWLCLLPRNERIVVVSNSFSRIHLAPLPIACPNEPSERLIDRHSVVLAPSATFWLAARERVFHLAEMGRAASVLALGIERVTGEADLPQAPLEAADVAELYPSRLVLLNEHATRSVVGQRVHNFDVLHFATHGSLDPMDSRGSYLSLADGRLDLAALMAGGRLERTRLAVLSACDTGGSVPDKDGLLGVSRGFLEIGVPTVVATLDTVKDKGARRLMTTFHRRFLATGDAALALAEAQREAARSTQEDLKKAPEWATWVVLGGG